MEDEKQLIFAYGFGKTTPDSDEFIKLIKSCGSKGMNWSTIEAIMADYKTPIDTEDYHNCLGIQEWVEPRRLCCPLSGHLNLTTNYYLVSDSIFPYVSTDKAIQFFGLRNLIWKRSRGECWLDLHIDWDVDQFIGTLSVLDKYMKKRSSVF